MGFIFFIIIIVAAIIIWQIFSAMKYREIWQKFANQHGLIFSGESFLEDPQIQGEYRNIEVTIAKESHGSGKSRQDYTHYQAHLDSTLMPEDLEISAEGFIDIFSKMFGGQDIQVGIPHVDQALRIKGQDEETVQSFLNDQEMTTSIIQFVQGHSCKITQDMVSILASGIEKNEYTLQERMDAVVNLALIIHHKLYGESYNAELESEASTDTAFPPIDQPRKYRKPTTQPYAQAQFSEEVIEQEYVDNAECGSETSTNTALSHSDQSRKDRKSPSMIYMQMENVKAVFASTSPPIFNSDSSHRNQAERKEASKPKAKPAPTPQTEIKPPVKTGDSIQKSPPKIDANSVCLEDLLQLNTSIFTPSEQEKLIQNNQGKKLKDKMTIRHISWSSSFQLPNEVHGGQTVVGELSCGLTIGVAFPQSRDQEIRAYSSGDEMAFEATFIYWDSLYKRLIFAVID
jgi:hypothetical protein